MRGRQVAGVVLRLLAGVVHQHIPGAGGFAATLVFLLREEVVLVWKLAALTPRTRLLRFQHEGAALVEIDEVAALVANKHEARRLKPIALPESDEVATLARKAKPVMEQYARDGKLQRGGVGAVVAELFGQDARNEGHNNRMAQRVISHFFETKGTAHAS